MPNGLGGRPARIVAVRKSHLESELELALPVHRHTSRLALPSQRGRTAPGGPNARAAHSLAVPSTTVAWTLTPAGDGDGTTVAFSHDGWADDGPLMASAAVTWGQLVIALKSYAETGTGPVVFPKAA